MKAWVIETLDQPMQLVEQPRPTPALGEVLVRVRAAGLNFADLLMARGNYQHRPTLPFIPGMELAGTVEALGPGVTGVALGAHVAAYLPSGAFAEWAVVPVARLLTLPEAMPFAHAAGFQIAYGTSHLALADQARLQPGETLFVTGAAGGVGRTAVEIGHLMGARVIAQVRGDAKAALARAAGADVVIGDDVDLKAALRELGGVDVVYDTVGGPGFEAALRATHPGGRMLAIGFAGGEVPQVPLNQLLVRNVSVIGFWWGGYLTLAPQKMDASLAELLDWYAQGKLKPHISAELSLAELPQGLEAIRNRSATGKIVISLP
ncbi:NADPH:quinone oxidoreductase family protein [Xinfangfangia sp. CPCC 101601]|uniref:NADPH:quinone oxidoreductase family protein n=1 Tax=Pseudogemmobacter lacusdianii TaxID=3069608 RepID=A0ABU0VT23_9RHOB|nr:NADPH:quinone oxidoreductase family protein [Xinfangfangia sp. CPCC 101601]MDQ2064871.1 NADPH:quinone oxidoreductase family protein [Xinfangfangia sp. CPCC 101601]